MRIFDVLNLQHFVLYLFPAIAFVVLFALALGFHCWERAGDEQRRQRIVERYPGGIEGRNAPFPFALVLILAGTLVWSLLYIVFIGLLKVRI